MDDGESLRKYYLSKQPTEEERKIRTLIQNYYTIQSLRIRTFNRLIDYVMRNADKIKAMIIEQVKDEKQRSEMLAILEKAQEIMKTPKKSRDLLRRENRLFSVFVEKYVITGKLKIEEIEEVVNVHNQMFQIEKYIYKVVNTWSKNHPLRKTFFEKVPGIGPILASEIIVRLCRPMVFAEHASNIWSYMGYAPNQKRERGKKTNFNPYLKRLGWLIGRSLTMKNPRGRQLFKAYFNRVSITHGKGSSEYWTIERRRNASFRYVAKLFIANVWEVWRRILGLPVTDPYPIQILGHDKKTKITPDKWYDFSDLGIVNKKLLRKKTGDI
jgi:hypothetical protein